VRDTYAYTAGFLIRGAGGVSYGIVRGIQRMRDVSRGSKGRRSRGRLAAYLCDDWVDGWIEVDYPKKVRQNEKESKG